MALKPRKQNEPVTYALVKALNETRKGVIATITTADATDAGTAVTLANALKAALNARAYSHYDPTASAQSGDFRDPSATTLAVGATTATTTATRIALANEAKADFNVHVADDCGHIIADATNDVTAADATNDATVFTLINAIKDAANAHFTEAGVHVNNDVVNTVTNDDATDATTGNTLCNEVKANLNAHFESAPTGTSLKLQAP